MKCYENQNFLQPVFLWQEFSHFQPEKEKYFRKPRNLFVENRICFQPIFLPFYEPQSKKWVLVGLVERDTWRLHTRSEKSTSWQIKKTERRKSALYPKYYVLCCCSNEFLKKIWFHAKIKWKCRYRSLFYVFSRNNFRMGNYQKFITATHERDRESHKLDVCKKESLYVAMQTT